MGGLFELLKSLLESDELKEELLRKIYFCPSSFTPYSSGSCFGLPRRRFDSRLLASFSFFFKIFLE